MKVDDLYINVLLIVAILTMLGIRKSFDRQKVVDVPPYWFAFILLGFAVYCMAEQPVPWGTWADRHGYVNNFLMIKNGVQTAAKYGNEVGFQQWMNWTSRIVDWKRWLYLTALVYVGNYWIAAWRFTRKYSYVLFLMMICCFQFYAYGTNTMRAGFAGSFIILGLSFCNNVRLMAVFLAIGLSVHNSMIIPIIALLLAWNIRKTNLFFIGWFLCIAVSYVIGESLQERVSFLIQEGRTEYLTSGATQGYKTGFRWDFLLYSSLPVIFGYYYIFKLNFKNEFYEFLYRMYLTANGFWVLVIRANFTDRFAYLSWFLFPILLVYPLLSRQLYPDAQYQARNISLVLWMEFGFNFLMFILYGGTLFGVKLL